MTYRGRVEKGAIVLEPGAQLVEGETVTVQTSLDSDRDIPEELKTLREGLLSFAGVAKGGPPDLALNHDHYLHGAPKK